jgi:hypothetical protein
MFGGIPINATASQFASQDSSQMAAESGANSNPSQGEATLSSEPSLAPVQLTPQRLQSIGVKFGTAELKQVQALCGRHLPIHPQGAAALHHLQP